MARAHFAIRRLEREYGKDLIKNLYLEINIDEKWRENKSLPYKHISRFSLETAGTFDLDAEFNSL